jgi:hypothetical protein
LAGRNGNDPEWVAEIRIGHFLAPFQGALIFPTCPGVSLCSTPGYLLATLRVGKVAQIEFVLIGEIRVCILALSENA